VTLADSGDDDIDVLSDLEVELNGETIFEDDDAFPNSVPFAALDPIEFQAQDGDRLRIIARTGVSPISSLDALSLFCSDGREQDLTDGESPAVPGSFQEFFNEEFTIDLGS